MEENKDILEEPQKDEISSAADQTPFEDKTIEQQAVQIQNLVQNGILNPQQGQYYMSQVAKQSYDRLNHDLNLIELNSAFYEFEKEKPDFFKEDGRAQVLDYIKNANSVFDKDEINIISQMVEKIEQCAIERFMKQQAHEKALNEANEQAKGKLMSNAQNAQAYNSKDRAFTREQIGRMSGAEFAKYEPLIMDQLRKGLIK